MPLLFYADAVRRSAGLTAGLLAIGLAGCANPYAADGQAYAIPVQPAFFGPAPTAPAAITPGPFSPPADANRAIPIPELPPEPSWETPPALLMPPPDAAITAPDTTPDTAANEPAPAVAAPAPAAPEASAAVPLMGFRPMRGQKPPVP